MFGRSLDTTAFPRLIVTAFSALAGLACGANHATDSGDSLAGYQQEPDSGAQPAWQARSANNRDFLPAALDIIQQADSRIHVIEFEISPYGPVLDIFQALEDAVERGVDVRLLADEAVGSTEGALSTLASMGIITSLDSPGTTTHNKLIISDSQVLVGSTNFSSSSIDYNNEVDLWIRSSQVTEYYESYFQALWADSDSEPQVSWTGGQDLVPLSNRDILDAELSCIQGASSQVSVIMYAMLYYEDSPDASCTRLVTALLDAHAAGRSVEVILDASWWITQHDINAAAARLLQSAGVDVRFTDSSIITHAKLLTCDDTVIVSDANWSTSGLDYYNGTSVQVTDQGIADQYRDYFQDVWETAQP